MAVADMGKREKRTVLKENHGLLSRVARSIGVSKVTVHEVYWEKKTSARVLAALDAELAAINGDKS